MKKVLLSILVAALCLPVSASGELFIGELTSPESGMTFKTGTFLGYSGKESSQPFVYGKPFNINGSALYEEPVDILFELSGNCFLDHIDLELNEIKAGSIIQVFRDMDGKTEAVCVRTELKKGPNSIVVAAYGDKFILRIGKEIGYSETAELQPVSRDYCKFTISNLKLYGAINIDRSIWPTPSELSFGDGVLASVTGVSAHSSCAFAPDNFIGKYAMLTGKSLKKGKKGNVVFALAKMPEEAFSIKVDTQGASVTGGSPRALLYASEKLLQLCDKEGHISCADINDKPAFPLRGIHFALSDRKNTEFIKRMVKYVYMPMGYNTIFLQLTAAMEFKSHPEINAKWSEAIARYKAGKGPKPPHYGFSGGDNLSHEEVREFCAYLRKYGMEIAPEIQLFGHTQYITIAHPELAERTEVEKQKVNQLEADERPDIKYSHTCCPNAKGYFELAFDLIDEAIDVIKPEKYIHIGHDEIYELGRCPLCTAEGGDNVYVREVTTLHDHIAAKGLKTVMWSDMIDEKKYAPFNSKDRLPKDIVCLPFTWYFHLPETMNIEDGLTAAGLQFAFGNLYSSHFPRFTARAASKNCLGGEVSTWSRANERSYGANGKMFDMVYTAEMLWNGKFKDNFRRTHTELVKGITSGLRERIHYDAVPASVQSEEIRNACAVVGRGEEKTYEVNAYADRIRISQATDGKAPFGPKDPHKPIAVYVIEYEDGTTAEGNIIYNMNIGEFKRAYGLPAISSVYRHGGYPGTYFADGISLKDSDGSDCSLWDYPLENPHPEKKISRLKVIGSKTLNIGIIIRKLSLEKLTYPQGQIPSPINGGETGNII